MVAKPRAAWEADSYGVIPGVGSGSPTKLTLGFDNLPTHLFRLYMGYTQPTVAIEELGYLIEYNGNVWDWTIMPADPWETHPITRSLTTEDDTYEYSFTNTSPDYNRVIPETTQLTPSLITWIRGIFTDTTLFAIDINASTPLSVNYAPALFIGALVDWLRQISVSLNVPIVDVFNAFIMFEKYRLMPRPPIIDFSTTATVPDTFQRKVVVNWNETTVYSPSSNNKPFIAYKLDQVISIGAGEAQEFTVQARGITGGMNFAQPVPMDAIPVRYIDQNLNNGDQPSIYCVTGSDGYVISAARWTDMGGAITVRPGDNGYDIVITITAPEDDSLAPFTITEGADRPALYIGADQGIAFVPRTTEVTMPEGRMEGWGMPSYPQSADIPSIDAPLVDTEDRAYSFALRYGNTFAAPQIKCSGVMQATQYFLEGEDVETPGRAVWSVGGESIPLLVSRRFYRDGNVWRITHINWDVESGTVAFDGEVGATFEDFNTNYAKQILPVDDEIIYYKQSSTNATFSHFNTISSIVRSTTFGAFDWEPFLPRPVELT